MAKAYENKIMKDNPSRIMTIFSENVRIYREKLGLTQEELAEKINVSKNTIQNFERQLQFPTLETLEKLVKGLSVDAYMLFLPHDEVIFTGKQFQEALENFKHDFIGNFKLHTEKYHAEHSRRQRKK